MIDLTIELIAVAIALGFMAFLAYLLFRAYRGEL